MNCHPAFTTLSMARINWSIFTTDNDVYGKIAVNIFPSESCASIEFRTGMFHQTAPNFQNGALFMPAPFPV